MTVACVIQALDKAKKHYRIPEGMILHTDLGSLLYSNRSGEMV